MTADRSRATRAAYTYAVLVSLIAVYGLSACSTGKSSNAARDQCEATAGVGRCVERNGAWLAIGSVHGTTSTTTSQPPRTTAAVTSSTTPTTSQPTSTAPPVTTTPPPVTTSPPATAPAQLGLPGLPSRTVFCTGGAAQAKYETSSYYISICQSYSGALYYYGENKRTGKSITLPAYASGDGYAADNGAAGYFISYGGLTVTVNGVVKVNEYVLGE